MKRFKILEMTAVIRNVCVFTMILLFSVSVKGDLVPKKLWEFDFKEKTGKDLRQIYGWTGINYGRTGSVLFVAYSKRQENIETAYSFWVTSSGRVFEISELIRPSLIAPPSPEFSVLDMDYETLAVYDGKKIIRLEEKKIKYSNIYQTEDNHFNKEENN